MKRLLSTTLVSGALLTAGLVTAPLIGCSKKEGEVATSKALTSPLLTDSLLKKLPSSTAGFVMFDFAGDGYQKFKDSPWGKDSHGLSAIKAAVDEMKARGNADEQAQLAQAVLDTAQKLGLVSADGASQVDKVVSRNVSFIEVLKDEALPFNVASFVEAAQGVDLTERMPILKKVAADAGLKVSDESFGSAKGFSAAVESEEDAEGPPVTLNVGATKGLLGVSLTKTTLQKLFSDQATKTIEELQALPEFKKVEESVRGPGAPLSFGFISLKRLSPLLDTIAEASEDAPDFKPSDSPLSAVAFSQGFSGQMVTLASLAVSPTNETQKTVVTAFENSTLPATAFKVPSDTAFSLSLDARVLAKLETVLGALSDPSTAMVVQQLKNIQGLTLGVRSSEGSSPIPDIFIALESNARESVASSVESAVGLGMMATGQPLQWQTKEISGSPTKYFTTMIGAGAYVSSPKNSNTLLIASSERLIRDTVSSNAGGSGSLENSMPNGLRERMAPSTVGSLYLNFVQLGNVMDSVKGTLAMVMGPTDDIDKALDSAKLKKLGVGFGSLSYADGVFRVQSTFERSDPAK